MARQRLAFPLALIPGAGHMALGRYSRGVPLASFALMMAAVLAFRWDAFRVALAGPSLGDWIASRFLIVGLLGSIAVSLIDTRGIIKRERSDGEGKRRGSQFSIALRRFSANGLAVGAIYMIAFLCVAAILAPIIAPYDPAAIGNVMETRYLTPSAAHLFGTDEFGRDLFSRAVYGARISLSVGLLAVVIAVTFGTVYGAVAGYFGGVLDNVLMRIVDVILAFPTFFLMLLLVAVFEADIVFLILILGFTSWTGTARIIRGEILSLREREFIEGARAIDLPAHLIIFRHLIPNAIAPVLVTAAMMVGGMITAEAGLSFLGIGIRPPTPSWGNMISAGQDALLSAWWIALFPGLLLSTAVLSFNLLADGVRDALDPKTLMRKYL